MRRFLVTSGRGPAECRIAVAHVLEAMAKQAVAAGLDLDVAYGAEPDRHGPASAVVVVEGDRAEEAAFSRSWLGSVLWVVRSPLRPHHKRKNWFVGVLELPAPALAVKPPAACEISFETMRAGGPGGQHQNKTESAVRAVHLPSGLSVVARDGRSQHRNKAIALLALPALPALPALLALRAELAASGDRMAVQAGHDRLERGRPVRRFMGDVFREG